MFKKAIEITDDDPNKESKAFKDMMKNERLMKKVKKHWRQLKLRLKLRAKADLTGTSQDNDKLKGAIKNEDDDDEEIQDDGSNTCVESFEKYVLIPGKSKYLLYWSLFMAIVISISLFLIGVT